jgi:hypothetical protein
MSPKSKATTTIKPKPGQSFEDPTFANKPKPTESFEDPTFANQPKPPVVKPQVPSPTKPPEG